jgi:septal ring factor EnvC (AmiA/AmiB activator)
MTHRHVDFTLKRINSSDTDYGQCLSESRTMLLEETIRNAYFWSNVVSLGLLVCLFFIALCQRKIQGKREWAIAEIVAQLEQNLTRSRAQVAEATKKNRDLADALAALKEPASRSASLPLESTDSAVVATTKPRTQNLQPVLPAAAKANPDKPQNGNGTRTATGREQIGQMRLFTPDADFVMKLNSLEQQLAQSREDNKQLRRRIADGDRKLEAEQERNRQFKGA